MATIEEIIKLQNNMNKTNKLALDIEKQLKAVSQFQKSVKSLNISVFDSVASKYQLHNKSAFDSVVSQFHKRWNLHNESAFDSAVSQFQKKWNLHNKSAFDSTVSQFQKSILTTKTMFPVFSIMERANTFYNINSLSKNVGVSSVVPSAMFTAINKANMLYNINSLPKNIGVSNWATSVMNESAISKLLKASEKLECLDATEKVKKNSEISVELTPITNYLSRPILKEKIKDTLGNELNEEEFSLIDTTLDFEMSPDNLIQLENSQELRDFYEEYPELKTSPTDEDIDIILKKCMLFVICIIFILSPYSRYADKILSLWGVYELLLKKMIEKKE